MANKKKWAVVTTITSVLIVLAFNGFVLDDGSSPPSSDRMYASDIRELLDTYPQFNLILVTNFSNNRMELYGRSNELGAEFYKYIYKDNLLKSYIGSSDLVDTSYWQVFNGSTMVRFRDIRDIEYEYDGNHTVIRETIDYYRDSRHKTYVGTLVRTIEIEPRSNKETVQWFPVPSFEPTKFNLKWVHETDHYERFNYRTAGLTSMDLDKINIDWSDAYGGDVTSAICYKTGRCEVRFKSRIGIQEIDPILSIEPSDVIAELITSPIEGVQYTPQCLSECHLPLRIKYTGLVAPDNYGFEQKDINYRFTTELIGRDNIGVDHINILVNVSYQKNVITDKKITCKTINYVDNDSKSQQREECTTKSTTGTVDLWKYEWQPLNSIKQIAKDEYFIIDYVGKRSPNLGVSSIDIVPTVLNKEFEEFDWWNSSWMYMTNITIDNPTGVDQLNFTVLLNGSVGINTEVLISEGKLKSDCTDLRFVDENNNELSWEWANLNSSFGCNSEGTQVYVKHPNIKGDGTSNISIFYGNNDTNIYGNNSQDAWNASYVAVWHFDECSGTSVHDSTSNGIDITETNAGTFWLNQSDPSNSGRDVIGCALEARVATLNVGVLWETVIDTDLDFPLGTIEAFINFTEPAGPEGLGWISKGEIRGDGRWTMLMSNTNSCGGTTGPQFFDTINIPFADFNIGGLSWCAITRNETRASATINDSFITFGTNVTGNPWDTLSGRTISILGDSDPVDRSGVGDPNMTMTEVRLINVPSTLARRQMSFHSFNVSIYTTGGEVLFVEPPPVEDITAPTFSNIVEDPTSPATYVQNQEYTFNVTWTNGSAPIDQVLIEHNFSGSFINETVTQFEVISDGSAELVFNSNDTANGVQVFSSAQANGIQLSDSFDIGTELTTTEYINIGEEGDGLLAAQTGGGGVEPFFRFKYVLPSNTSVSEITDIDFRGFYCDNQGASMNKEFFAFNWTSNNWVLISTSNGDIDTCPSTEDRTYNLTANFSSYFNTTTDEIMIGFGFQRDSGGYEGSFDFANLSIFTSTESVVYTHTEFDLPASPNSYQWEMFANNTDNQTNSTGNQSYSVNKADSPLILLLNGSASNVIQTEVQAINATGFEELSVDTDVTYELARNGTVLASGSIATDITTLSAGVYNYTYNSTGGENYTSNHTELLYEATLVTGNSTILLDGLKIDRKYEFDTTANITVISNKSGLTVCLDINGVLNLTNISCGVVPHFFNFTIPERITILNSVGDVVFELTFQSLDTEHDVSDKSDFDLDPVGFTINVTNQTNVSSAEFSINGTLHPNFRPTSVTPIFDVDLFDNLIIPFRNGTKLIDQELNDTIKPGGPPTEDEGTRASVVTGSTDVIREVEFSEVDTPMRIFWTGFGSHNFTAWLFNYDTNEWEFVFNATDPNPVAGCCATRLTWAFDVPSDSYISDDRRLRLSWGRDLANNIPEFNSQVVSDVYATMSNGKYPQDLNVTWLEENVSIDFRGRLIGNTVWNDRISNKLTEVMVFGAAGSASREILYAVPHPLNSPFLKMFPLNLTINISGESANTENFTQTELFDNGTFINTTDQFNNILTNSSTPEWIYDDFHAGLISGRWSFSGSGAVTAGLLTTTSSKTGICDRGASSCSSQLPCVTFTDVDNTKTLDINAEEYRKIEMAFTMSSSGNADGGCGCSYTSSSSGSASIGLISNEDSSIPILYSISSSASTQACQGNKADSDSDTGILTIEIDGLSVRILSNGGEVTTGTLAADKTYGIYYSTSGSGNDINAGGSATVTITELNASGARGIHAEGLRWNSSVIQSKTLTTFEDPIITAVLTAETEIPEGSSIDFFLSNDGHTFESVASGVGHVFDSSGTNLTWRADIIVSVESGKENSSSFPSISPIIKSVIVEISQGFAQNFSLDLGGDGISDFVFNQEINQTQITAEIDDDVIIDYITTNCLSDTICEVPIIFEVGSSGTINFTNVTSRTQINALQIDSSATDGFLQTNDNIDVDFFANGGNITIDDINFTFADNFNITVTSYEIGTLPSILNDTRTIIARFSNFIRTFPAGISTLNFLPTTVNDKNVTPFGQLNGTTIVNYTSLAQLDPFNTSIRLNQSIPDVFQLLGDTIFDGCNGQNISTSRTQFITGIGIGGNGGTYLCLNLFNVNRTALGAFVQSKFVHSSICEDCVRTFSWRE